MKHIFAAILIPLLLAGCNLSESSGPVGSHCYLATADSLVNGRTWPDRGSVSDAFYTINTDPDLEFYYTSKPDLKEIAGWLSSGYRVAIQYYSGNGMEHSQPINDVSECIGKHLTWAFVAGYFNEATEQ